jgi:Domain of unknown function (DUF4157)/Putative RNase-like toxin, toxin_1
VSGARARDSKSAEVAKPTKSAAAPRLTQPGDRYEREAERAADLVAGTRPAAGWSLSTMNTASHPAALQRECTCGDCESCRKAKVLQRDAQGAAPDTAPSVVQDVLRGSGRPIEAGTRRFMESRFGHDFSAVRVFDDEAAAASARAVSANAYTVGEKIVFNRHRYAPTSFGGRKLLAHELAHVVQQSGGGTAPAISGNPALEGEAGQIAHHIDSPGVPLSVRQTSAVGIARDPAPAEQSLIEVKFPDGVKQLTPDQFAEYKRRALHNLRVDLNGVASQAEYGRKVQTDTLAEYQGGVESFTDLLKKPKALIGIAADIKAGVTPPYIGMWGNSKHEIEQGLAACDRGDLAEAARLLRAAEAQFREAMHTWNEYREATIGGAEGVASNLETVRDVSFAIALAAGAAVAAPVIAAAVGSAGLTGATATVVTTGTTALVTGAGGAALRGTSTAAASYVSTGKVDFKAVKRDAWKGTKEGLVTGLTAGLGTALSGAGAATKLAQPLVQAAAKRCLTEAGINVAGEVTTELLDAAVPPPVPKREPEAGPKPLIPGPARAALTGCVSGALGVPVAKLGRTGAKATEVAVGAGVGFADAKLQGQSNRDAALAALQNVATSAAIAHGHAGTEHAKAQARQAPAAPAEAPAGVSREAPNRPKPPADASHEQNPAARRKEGSPAILEEHAKSKEPIGNGHEVVVTEYGIGVCSPGPCPVIHVAYAKELNEHAWAKKRYAEIEATRKTDPQRAAQESARFVKVLEMIKGGAGKGNAGARAEPHAGATQPGADLPLTLGVGKEKLAQIESGERNFVGDRALTFDIDEVLPVGQKGIKGQRAVDRAMSAHNRQLLDPNTNQRTKGLGIDMRELRANRGVREPISIAQDPSALITRRFSEVHEMNRIFNEAVASVKEPQKLKPTELKAAINRETRRIITEGKGPDAVAVRKALKELGFERLPGVGFAMTRKPDG